MEPEEFLVTSAGFMVTVYTIWNISGATALLGIIIIGGITVWSFRHFHMSKGIMDKKGKTVYVRRFKFLSSDEGGEVFSIIAHLVAFVFVVAMFLGLCGVPLG